MAMRLHRGLALGLSVLALGTAMAPSVAFAAPTAASVVALAMRPGKPAFTGTRTQQCVRQDMILNAKADVVVHGPESYRITVRSPADIDGMDLVREGGKLSCLFPKDSLYFETDTAGALDEVPDMVLGKLTADPALLARNYTLRVEEGDPVALYPTWKLVATPKGGLGPKVPPGHRIWVARETGQILREERYWSDDLMAYFISKYERVGATSVPGLGFSMPNRVNKLSLAKGQPTRIERYPTVEAARAAGHPIATPTLMSPGFVLRAVDVWTLYDANIVLLRYDDGLSELTVTYRPKQNGFLALVAGAYALGMVGRISSLSYHAPNNYAVVEQGGNYVYAYGDLYVDALKEIATSVKLANAR